MSSALCALPTLFLPGEVRLVDAIDLSSHLAEAEANGLLPVRLPPPGPALRGQLALGIEESIDAALERRGACPPGVGAASSLDASFSDQLYRARLLEFSGIALAIPALSGVTDARGALDPDDSAVLRWWLSAAEQASLWLLLDRLNTTLGVYGPPRPFLEFLAHEAANRAPGEPAPVPSPAVADSSAAMALSEPPPAVLERDGALAFQQPLDGDETESVGHDDEHDTAVPAEVAEIAGSAPAFEAEPAPAPFEADGGVEPASLDAEPADRTPEQSAAAPSEPAVADGPRRVGDITDAIVQSLVEVQADKSAATAALVERPEPERPEAGPAVRVPALFPNAAQQWRTWLHDLEGARGAKPLSAIERMFVSSYVPLRYAIQHGHADAEAARVVDRWGTSFAQSYREAFEALRVRGKRPSMVLDAPEIALRIGRLHGARSVQLVLIDGLRFDLGLRVEQRVRALLGQQAALTERLLLWSALPSTTEVQLELLGRGADALREPATAGDFEVTVARGRAASTLRRVKSGHRELLKLDLVEAGISEPGGPEAERLDALGDETARVLADYLVKQMPRTLVFTFGDHGFHLDPLDGGTARARQGGSSPEEVLVPAFAWLVGGLH